MNAIIVEKVRYSSCSLSRQKQTKHIYETIIVLARNSLGYNLLNKIIVAKNNLRMYVVNFLYSNTTFSKNIVLSQQVFQN